MKFCPNCGAKIEGTPKFCANCGAPIDTAPETVEIPAPAAPAAPAPAMDEVVPLPFANEAPKAEAPKAEAAETETATAPLYEQAASVEAPTYVYEPVKNDIPQGYPYSEAPAEEKGKKGVLPFIAFGLSIGGTIIGCIKGFAAWIGAIMVLAAIVIAIIALVKKNKPKWASIIGIIVSVLGIFAIITAAIAYAAIDYAKDYDYDPDAIINSIENSIEDELNIDIDDEISADDDEDDGIDYGDYIDVKEYINYGSMYTFLYYIAENTSEKDVDIQFKVELYDENDDVIDTDYSDAYSVAPGEKVLFITTIDNDSDVYSASYAWAADKADYPSLSSKISYTEDYKDGNIVIHARNDGDEECYATFKILFFKDGEAVCFDYANPGENIFEFQPGEESTVELSPLSYEFDDYILMLNAY